MIVAIRKSRAIKSLVFLNAWLIIFQTIWPNSANATPNGNKQAEMNGASSGSEMVNTFTGDFSYSIPLLSVGGYPLTLTYNAGPGVEQEASWVGLGWTLNPGMVNKTMNGLPDDFNGDAIVDTTYFKRYVLEGHVTTISASGSGQPFDGLDISIGVNADLELEKIVDNYSGKGFGIGLSLGIPIGFGFSAGKGPASAQLGLAPKLQLSHNSFQGFNSSFGIGVNATGSAYVGINFSGAVSGSYNSRTGLTSSSLHGGAEPFAQVSTKDIGIPIDKLPNQSGNITPMGMFGGFTSKTMNALPGMIPSTTPPLFYQSKSNGGGLTAGVSLGVGNVGVGIKHSKYTDENWVKRYSTTYLAKGTMYEGNELGTTLTNPFFLNDYYKLTQFRKFTVKTNFLPQISNTPDDFSISAAGFYNSYKVQRNSIGLHFEPYTVSNTAESGYMGREVIVNATLPVWGVDINDKFKNERNTRKRWSTSLIDKLSYSNTPYKNQPTSVFRSQQDLIFENEDYLNAVGGVDKLNTNLLYVTDDNSATAIDNDLAKLNTHDGVTNTSPVKQNNVLEYLTADEASKVSRNKRLNFFEYNGGNYQEVSESRVTSFRKPHHISEIQVVGANSARYVYDLPVYNKVHIEKVFAVNPSTLNSTYTTNDILNSKLVTYSINDDNLLNQSGRDNYYSAKSIPPYTTGFLLTEVLGANYQDVTQDGPTYDDLGDYVKFSYVRTAKNFKWRNPSNNVNQNLQGVYLRGLRSDNANDAPLYPDDKVTYVYGERENYYIRKIESKTELAIFYLSERNDSRQVWDKNGGLDYTSGTGSFKLDSISLFSKYALTQDEDALPITTVIFNYDYSLCNVDENDNPIQGKLTLKSLYSVHNGNREGQLNRYSFSYNTTYLGGTVNFKYSPNNVDQWGNYKEQGLNDNSQYNKFPYNQFVNDYPFAYQTTLTNEFAKAWSINKIGLPTGGEIEIDYESDSYTYVQDKQSMTMYKIYGFHPENPRYNTIYPNVHTNRQDLNTLWNCQDGVCGLIENRKQKKYIIIELPDNTDETYKTVTSNLINQPIFFNIMAKIFPDRSVWEPITGYGTVKNFGRITTKTIDYGNSIPFTNNVNEDNEDDFQPNDINGEPITNLIYAEIELLSFTDENGAYDFKKWSPLSYAAWQFARTAYPNYTYKWPDDVWEYLAQISYDVKLDVNGLFNVLEGRNFGRQIDVSKSWVRLNTLNHEKFGGGHRVKTITYHDKWSDMLNLEEMGNSYRVKYSYLQNINGNFFDVYTSNPVSSGVASYEPSLGADENPLKVPVKDGGYHYEIGNGPDDYFPIIGPLCEQYYPTPFVGYSRVTKEVLPYPAQPSNNDLYNTGSIVYSYHTYKEHPYRVDPTLSKISKIAYDESRNFVGSLMNGAVNNITNSFQGTQVYGVYTNDIHGKPDMVSYLDNNNSIVRSVKYKYTNPSPNGPNRTVKVLRENGFIEDKVLGDEVEIAGEAYESIDHTRSVQKTKNIQFFLIIPIPRFSKVITNMYHKLNYLSMTKSVNLRYVPLGVEYTEGPVKYDTKNELYDERTATPIVTSVSTPFTEERNYTSSIPAYFAYPQMGGAYKTLHRTGKITIANGESVTDDVELVEGDILLLTNIDNRGDYYKAWIKSVVPGTTTNNIYVIDQTGKFIPNGTFNYKVISSGYTNNLGASIAQYTTYKKPFSSTLDFDQNDKITAAATTLFTDENTFHKGSFENQLSYSIPGTKYTSFLADLLLLLNQPFNVPCSTNCTPVGAYYNNYLTTVPSYTAGLKDFQGIQAVLNVRHQGTIFRKFIACQITLTSVDGTPVDYNQVTSFASPPNGLPAYLIDKNEWYVWANGANKLIKVSGSCIDLGIPQLSCANLASCGLMNGNVVNPFLLGLKNSFKPRWSYVNYVAKDYSPQPNLKADGELQSFSPFWQINAGNNYTLASLALGNWLKTSDASYYSPYKNALEVKNTTGNKSSVLYAYNNSLPIAQTSNAGYTEMFYDGFEDYYFTEEIDCHTCLPLRHMRVYRGQSSEARWPVSSAKSHTGHSSALITDDDLYVTSNPITTGSNANLPEQEYRLQADQVLTTYQPQAGEHLLTCWVNRGDNADYSDLQISINQAPYTFSTSIVDEVEGWKRIEIKFSLSQGVSNLEVLFQNADSNNVYYMDDFRIHPLNAEMGSTVYDKFFNRLMAELDVKNYATFYEYDQKGNLVRTKRETEKGIYTISENRSNLSKQ